VGKLADPAIAIRAGSTSAEGAALSWRCQGAGDREETQLVGSWAHDRGPQPWSSRPRSGSLGKHLSPSRLTVDRHASQPWPTRWDWLERGLQRLKLVCPPHRNLLSPNWFIHATPDDKICEGVVQRLRSGPLSGSASALRDDSRKIRPHVCAF